MKKSPKILSIILVMVVAFGMLAFTPSQAQAAEKKFYTDQTLYIGVVTNLWSDEDLENSVISVKSSNPKIIHVKRSGEKSNIYSYVVTPKKAGKATITVTYKTKSGEQKTAKIPRKVKAYPNMVKSLKINGKKITVNKKKNNTSYFINSYKKTSAKVILQPAKGWKVDQTYGFVYDTKQDIMKEKKISKSAVKKGTAISFPKKYDLMDISVVLVNTKTGDTIDYFIMISR